MIESQKSNFERTVLVGVINDSQNEEKLNEFLATYFKVSKGFSITIFLDLLSK